MPKYYIKSGEIKYIIDSRDHESAILSAIYYYKNRNPIYGPKICVSEKGFDTFREWTCYDTKDYFVKEN